MRHGPALLRTSAALLWIITLVTAITGFDDDPRQFSAFDFRLWLCVLALSILASLAAFQQAIAAKAARLYTEMTKAAVTRPPYGDPPSGPMAKLAASGPMAKLMPFVPPQNGHHGRHSRL